MDNRVFMGKPVVASYCTTFLKREMLHIYRQVTSLHDYDTFVMTKALQNSELFPFRDIEIGHRTATHSHLGNIAYWLKRPLRWDPIKEEIIGDPEANRWLDRPMREPWTLA